MEIGKAIRQSRFRNEHQKATINLIFTYNWLMERLRQHFALFGLTLQQYNILSILRGSRPTPLTVLDLKDRMLDKHCDASRIAERLLAKGLIEKKPCAEDKRRVDISLSTTGLDLLQRVDESNDDLDCILSGLTAVEAASLGALLDKVRQQETESEALLSKKIAQHEINTGGQSS